MDLSARVEAARLEAGRPEREFQLRVEAVTIVYPRNGGLTTAVDRVSCEIAAGERFVILGPSGCGKTTLLKSIAGFQPVSSGRILLNGLPVTAPGRDRAFVFQEFDQLLPWRTVLGNVLFSLLRARQVDRRGAAARAMRYLRMVGLEADRDIYPHQLSGGMKQRVAIARALAAEPDVLLMDEPFVSLDAITRTRMQGELLQIWEQTRRTILFVTHNIQEAVILGSRIMVMSRSPGRVTDILENHIRADAPLDSVERMQFQAKVRSLLDAPHEGTS